MATVEMPPSEGPAPVGPEQIIRYGTVFAAALELFDGQEGSAARWVSNPRLEFGNQTALTLAKSDAGVRRVQTLVGQILHGVVT